jgi:hypothetical protein
MDSSFTLGQQNTPIIFKWCNEESGPMVGYMTRLELKFVDFIGDLQTAAAQVSYQFIYL